MVKFRFSKKATKIDEIFTVDLTLYNVIMYNIMYVVSVKLMVKILSIFVAFLENMNFKSLAKIARTGVKEGQLYNGRQ